MLGGAEVVVFTRTVFTRPGLESAKATQFVLSGLIGLTGEDRRFVPFAGIGPSFVSNPDGGAGFGWTVGGGANIWVTRRVGVRSDVRLIRPFVGEDSFGLVRLGIVVR